MLYSLLKLFFNIFLIADILTLCVNITILVSLYGEPAFGTIYQILYILILLSYIMRFSSFFKFIAYVCTLFDHKDDAKIERITKSIYISVLKFCNFFFLPENLN